MNKCRGCGSIDIIETEDFHGYFREGEWIRLRVINVWRDPPNEYYVASCPEKSPEIAGTGNTELDAIISLGERLQFFGKGELLGNKLDVMYE